MTTDPSPRIGIVGGGIAGLAAAHALADAGARVTVLDKGRGPGGRTSMRRRDGHAFDHGAQYFTARDAAFRAHVQAWARAGVVAEWPAALAQVDRAGVLEPKGPGESRWVGVPGMSALARHLAATLDGRADVRFGVRVARVDPRDDGWRLLADDGSTHDADVLLVCVPAPQAVELVDGLTPLADEARRLTMQPCWSAMVAFDERLPLDADGLFVNLAGEPLSWAARDSAKPGRPPGERWVLHGAPAWSRAHLDDAPEAVPGALLDALARATGRALPAPVFADAHRWRFAQGALDGAPGALVDAARRLTIAGDWCAGGRVEGAWSSGVAAAAGVLGPRAVA